MVAVNAKQGGSAEHPRSPLSRWLVLTTTSDTIEAVGRAIMSRAAEGGRKREANAS